MHHINQLLIEIELWNSKFESKLDQKLKSLSPTRAIREWALVAQYTQFKGLASTLGLKGSQSILGAVQPTLANYKFGIYLSDQQSGAYLVP